MFETRNICLDLKDLEMLKNSLEGKIESLENQNFAGEEVEVIDEYKQLLIKISSNLKKIQNF
jgi:hypothetical protein